MDESDPKGTASRPATLRVRDRIPVEVRPLAPEWVTEAEAGRLGADLSDRPESDTRRHTSVEELFGAYPPDQRPEGPMAEALRLLDAKVDYLVRLLEETPLESEAELPPARSVELGVDGMALEPAEGGGPELQAESWVWIRAFLPGRPRIRFEAPARVRPSKESREPGAWVELAFANVTDNEERVLSGYIFRRHREEVRRLRERGEA